LSGNTAWHNAVRARFYMKGVKPEAGERPDNDLREIVFKKNNYGPVSDTIVVRYTNGLFLPVPGVASLDRAAREINAEAMFLELLSRFTRENRRVCYTPSSTFAPTSSRGRTRRRKPASPATILQAPCGACSPPAKSGTKTTASSRTSAFTSRANNK
jgi:hypothetical protein